MSAVRALLLFLAIVVGEVHAALPALKAVATPKNATTEAAAKTSLRVPVVQVQSKAVAAPAPAAAPPVAPYALVPAPAPVAVGTVAKHSISAAASAARAQQHLEEAKKAYLKTKANVKVIRSTGAQIEDTANKIQTLYPKPPVPKSRGQPSASPVFAMLMLVAGTASTCTLS
mmetsp:Transcript_112363/g.194892  ORF Transcript_112363/g.194892 Transcript_112363/m.194892 type:complete len:172 (-) Transcript_112363:276-791(-)